MNIKINKTIFMLDRNIISNIKDYNEGSIQNNAITQKIKEIARFDNPLNIISPFIAIVEGNISNATKIKNVKDDINHSFNVLNEFFHYARMDEKFFKKMINEKKIFDSFLYEAKFLNYLTFVEESRKIVRLFLNEKIEKRPVSIEEDIDRMLQIANNLAVSPQHPVFTISVHALLENHAAIKTLKPNPKKGSSYNVLSDILVIPRIGNFIAVQQGENQKYAVKFLTHDDGLKDYLDFISIHNQNSVYIKSKSVIEHKIPLNKETFKGLTNEQIEKYSGILFSET